jgi:hypothetical protein
MVQRTDGELFWDGTTALMTASSTPFYAAQGAFSAGPSSGYLACAIDNSGTGALWCVGTNGSGALGAGLDPASTSSSSTPVQVLTALSTPLTGITQVAVDPYEGENACAIGAGGAVWCWGYYYYGVLGNGSTSNENYATPVLVSAGGAQLTGATQISVSYDHACAILNGGASGGSLYCWGYNYYGELGIHSSGSSTPVDYPTYVADLFATVVSVSVGYEFTCALTVDQTVSCWGENNEGILGNGTATGMSAKPVQVQTVAGGDGGSPFGGVASLQTSGDGYGSACALKASNGALYCWGEYSGSTNSYLPIKYSQSELSVSNVFMLCPNNGYYPGYIDDTGAFNDNGSTPTQPACQ